MGDRVPEPPRSPAAPLGSYAVLAMGRSGQLALVAVLFLPAACSTPGVEQRLSSGPLLPGPEPTYLRPNFIDADGTRAYVHFTPEMMPITIVVSDPFDAPAGGTPAEARRAVIEGFLLWEEALRVDLPWFRLEWVDTALGATLVVVWERRMSSPKRGRTRCRALAVEQLLLSCRMELAVGRIPPPVIGGLTGGIPVFQSSDSLVGRQTVRQLRNLAAHEFGHVLGLGHCWCDSIMNYRTGRMVGAEITEIDRRTLLALISVRQGLRLDGEILSTLKPRDLH